MTLQQLSAVKRWHIVHHRQASVEYWAWDAVLTCWMLGWMGLPPAVLLAPGLAVLPCVALFFVPSAYVALRRRWHHSGPAALRLAGQRLAALTLADSLWAALPEQRHGRPTKRCHCPPSPP